MLPLHHNYETFLDSLGYKARRNMRYYRRRFEAAGHQYVERVDPAEFRRVAFRLLERSVVGAHKEGVLRSLGMLSEVDHPLLSGLRRSDGEWTAIIGGWRDGGLPIVFIQLNNDRDYAADSLCVVLRGYFFETLLAQGFRRVAFWAGVGGPLARVASPEPAVMTLLDVGTRRWRAMRALGRALAPHLPNGAQQAVNWAAPVGE